jgi:tRNA-splicing ligase RtcB
MPEIFRISGMHISNIIYKGDHDEATIKQIQNCATDEYAQHAVLCADGHKGWNMPIGGVVAYENHISPAGVGFDIACGNKAVQLNVTYDQIKDDLAKIADEIFASLSFGVGRVNNERVEHDVFNDAAWRNVDFLRKTQSLMPLAREQLGTIGSGNHYVDVFKDEKDCVWVGVHFGSRGLGHKIATEFITQAGANPNGNMDDPPCLLDVNTPLGEDYIQAMNLAGRYAYAGRDWVCQKVASILGTQIVEEIHNHHNYAWRENHFGKDVWVVRKGATPAAPGQKGFVGGSMGENSVILEGVDTEESAKMLYSTVHGAGRVMSRTQAAGKSRWVNGEKIRVSEGLVNMDNVLKNLSENGVILRGGGADEAPEVYKRLPEVLAHHGNTIKVVHQLNPLIVCMAGSEIRDPYKD